MPRDMEPEQDLQLALALSMSESQERTPQAGPAGRRAGGPGPGPFLVLARMGEMTGADAPLAWWFGTRESRAVQCTE